MADRVIKVLPDADQYLIRNTISNLIVAWGSRAETIEHLYELSDLKRERIDADGRSPSHPVNVVDKADRYGSSSGLGSDRWGAETIPVEGAKRVRREDLQEVYRRFDALEDPDGDIDLSDLFVPDENDDEDDDED